MSDTKKNNMPGRAGGKTHGSAGRGAGETAGKAASHESTGTGDSPQTPAKRTAPPTTARPAPRPSFRENLLKRKQQTRARRAGNARRDCRPACRKIGQIFVTKSCERIEGFGDFV